MYIPQKIISGGQTGADIGGLVGAKRLGIATGGTAPRGYKTEKGAQEVALKAFGLVPHPSAHYKDRTRENVLNSDATLIFSTQASSSGTTTTINCCEAENKPYCLLERIDDKDLKIARAFINNHKPRVLNIAGNRESVSPGLAKTVAAFIEQLFAAEQASA